MTGVNQVALSPGEFFLDGLYGDTAVGYTRGPDGRDQVAVMNLATLQMKQISSAVDTECKRFAHISKRWAIWIEDLHTSEGAWTQRLKAYDLEQEQEFQLDAGLLEAVDLSGDIAVWVKRTISPSQYCQADLLAQNLATGKGWTIATSLLCSAYPRISAPWVVYLKPGETWETIEEQGYGWHLDLRAHHLDTGEDFLIGQVPAPPDSSAGKYHTIAASKVVWIKYQPDPVSQLHVFNLETRADSPLILSDGRQVRKFLQLFGEDSLIVQGAGETVQQWFVYSLDDGQLLSVIDTSALGRAIVVYRVYMSGSYITLNAFKESESGDVWSLYILQLSR